MTSFFFPYNNPFFAKFGSLFSYFFAFFQLICTKNAKNKAFAVRSNQTLVEIYNKELKEKKQKNVVLEQK